MTAFSSTTYKKLYFLISRESIISFQLPQTTTNTKKLAVFNKFFISLALIFLMFLVDFVFVVFGFRSKNLLMTFKSATSQSIQRTSTVYCIVLYGLRQSRTVFFLFSVLFRQLSLLVSVTKKTNSKKKN